MRLYLDQNTEVLNRHRYTIIDLLSYVGGLSNILRILVALISSLFLESQISYQMIKRLYFDNVPNFLGIHLTSISQKYNHAFTKWDTIKI